MARVSSRIKQSRVLPSCLAFVSLPDLAPRLNAGCSPWKRACLSVLVLGWSPGSILTLQSPDTGGRALSPSLGTGASKAPSLSEAISHASRTNGIQANPSRLHKPRSSVWDRIIQSVFLFDKEYSSNRQKSQPILYLAFAFTERHHFRQALIQ